MDRKLTVTYYHHSGFSVAMDDILLVFDYWTGEHGELPEDKRITVDFLKQFRQVYVFISHEHPDHLDPVVFTWRSEAPVTYIVSADMPVGTRGKRMAPGDSLTLSPEVSVKAFDSTDLGVSFLVDIQGVHVFHAGDLNFWHWREESTVKEIEEADDAFRQAVEPIAREKIDLAFFPVDARQGLMYDALKKRSCCAISCIRFAVTYYVREAASADSDALLGSGGDRHGVCPPEPLSADGGHGADALR